MKTSYNNTELPLHQLNTLVGITEILVKHQMGTPKKTPLVGSKNGLNHWTLEGVDSPFISQFFF